MVRAGVYREGNAEDERSFTEQLAQMELDFTQGANDVYQQSKELGLDD